MRRDPARASTHTIPQLLRAALREDPDVIPVGEMRDLETVTIAIETAEMVTGPRHVAYDDRAVSAVDRAIDQFPPEQQEQVCGCSRLRCAR
jgi:twitching motility protein PilT